MDQASSEAEYEKILLRICKLVTLKDDNNIEHIFSVFSKQDGCIDSSRLRKLFEVIGFNCKDLEFDTILQNAA